MKKTLYQKIWEQHVVTQVAEGVNLLYVDLHLVHEVTSPQAFANLRKKQLNVRRPDKTFSTTDHNVSTKDQTTFVDELSRIQVETLMKNCNDFGITLYGLDSPFQGIVHVIGPEKGLSQPGMTIVCGDSHTSTHGAFGALAYGIGTTEVEQVLATQCLMQHPTKTMEVRVNGTLGKGVTAKDIILTILKTIGTKGGIGYTIEYTGEAIRALNMEQRMTICNMSIEAGARAGLIAPDEVTFEYLRNREFVAKGKEFENAVEKWKLLRTDEGAIYDKTVIIDGSSIEPLITYGTDPATGIRIGDTIPDPEHMQSDDEKRTLQKALDYMNLKPEMSLEGFPIDYVFIGSCTNSRIYDLREAAYLIKGKKVNNNVIAMVVPGSKQVKIQAEKEGLDKVFIEAGFEWRWAGCSACIAMNEDKVPPGKYCVSTSNRNYEGRQGPGSRTFLASPIMAAAAAIEGKIVDVRKYL